MAVASLRYRPNAAPVDESKAGFVYFSGVPREYHYWHFRTMLKFDTLPTLPEPATPTAPAAAPTTLTVQAAAPPESDSGATYAEIVTGPQVTIPTTPSCSTLKYEEEVPKLDDKRNDTERQVVEALCCDALNVVMENSIKNRVGFEGPQKLVDAMVVYAFPHGKARGEGPVP